MSRSLYRRLTPFLAARSRENHRLLNSSSALNEASSSSPSSDSGGIYMTDSCVKRMRELQASETSKENLMLRLGVETAGCSGFQYVFHLDDKSNPDERVFEREGVKLVIDNVSYDFVKGATINFVEELIRSAVVVSTNPGAVGGCSCKSSFMVKQ